MAAGLGFKDFTTGEVLTAADVDGYLMQGVWVFASAAARDAAVTSPQEGNFAYLKDTNVTTYYTGSAWANLDTTGMTNPMTTTGDTIYSSSGSTPARLGIGTAGQVLQVNSGATAPEWATPSSGGMTLLDSGSLTGASVTTATLSTSYKDLYVVMRNIRPATDGAYFVWRYNSDANTRYTYSTGNTGTLTFTDTYMGFNPQIDNGTSQGLGIITIPDYANTSTWKSTYWNSSSNNNTTNTSVDFARGSGFYNQTGAITSITFLLVSGNFTSGDYYVYGVK